MTLKPGQHHCATPPTPHLFLNLLIFQGLMMMKMMMTMSVIGTDHGRHCLQLGYLHDRIEAESYCAVQADPKLRILLHTCATRPGLKSFYSGHKVLVAPLCSSLVSVLAPLLLGTTRASQALESHSPHFPGLHLTFHLTFL